jgi:signal transduction histidine kinase/CheY-like chemotaxis protein
MAEFLTYLQPEDRETMRAHIQRVSRDGQPYNVTYQLVRQDGTIAHLHARGNARRDATGRVVEIYGTTQDITERVRAEKERLELQERVASAERLESLGLLAGGIAHDFNNLLMGVMMDASLLEREVASQSSIADVVVNIQEAASRMAELTNQLLAYAGRGRFVLESIDPNEVVTTMVESLRRNLNPRISLDTEIARDSVIVAIDSSQLRQVVTNLVMNASDALDGRPGKIAIRTRIDKTDNDAGTWVLEVIDSGMGMAEDVQRRIFEPFFTTKQERRGLGLSTVHGIVQRSKGTIDVRSALGSGTTFSVRLPRVNESVPSTQSTQSMQSDAPAPTEPRPLRILVADDEAMVRRSLRRMLELNRAQVVVVADGAAAIKAMDHATEPFNLALLDIMMPRMNGYDVLSEVRRRHLSTKIILMSGYNNMEHVAETQLSEHEADALLQKPFAWDELKRLVQLVTQQDPPCRGEKR